MKKAYSVSLLLLLAQCVLPHAAAADGFKVVGWVERSRIYPGGMMFIAKLDTGARSSSINARNIETYERDGEPWVRFDVVNKLGKVMSMDLPQYRDVTIKRHYGEKEERPVVLLEICIGTTRKETPVSLVDRHGFLYPLLVGRRYMSRSFAVNPRKKFTIEPDCGEAGPDE